MPIVPVIILLVGGYLGWFGVHYWRSDVTWPTDPVKSVLTGQPLPDNTPSTPSAHAAITADVAGLQPDPTSTASTGSGGSGGSGSGSSSGSKIADDALKYKGAGYVFGGPANKVGNWDCSSFTSYVLGHDLGMKLPGGKWGDPGFPPHAHGPTTLNYLLFGTAIEEKDVQPGDLIVSTEHMGICTKPVGAAAEEGPGQGEMISAQDPQLGTNVSNFPSGFPAGPPHYRRVT